MTCNVASLTSSRLHTLGGGVQYSTRVTGGPLSGTRSTVSGTLLPISAVGAQFRGGGVLSAVQYSKLIPLNLSREQTRLLHKLLPTYCTVHTWYTEQTRLDVLIGG